MSVALSDLNRAALGGREQYGWIHFAAFAYCVIVGGFSVAAWLEADEVFRAAVCGGAQVLAIVCAILARRSFTGQMKGVGVVCLGIALGFAVWAAKGLEHAWASNGASIEEWQVWFLTASEPALFLLAEHVKEGREALRAAHQREVEEDERRERQREQRQRPVLATSGGMALAALPAGANASEIALPPAQTSERPAIVSTNPGYASAREHAVALKTANPALTEAEASAALGGRARSTIGKWWREAGLTKKVAA